MWTSQSTTVRAGVQPSYATVQILARFHERSLDLRMQMCRTAQQPIGTNVEDIQHGRLRHFRQDLLESKQVVDEMVVGAIKVRLAIVIRNVTEVWLVHVWRYELRKLVESPRRNHVQQVVEIGVVHADVCFQKQLQNNAIQLTNWQQHTAK